VDQGLCRHLLEVAVKVLRLRSDGFVTASVGLTLILALAPFGYYAAQRASGALGTPDLWFLDHNHGPWRWTAPGLFVCFPLLLLMPLTLAVGLVRSVRNRSTSMARATALVVLLQATGLALHLQYLFWTID
jgi:hypothetical protein